VPAGKKKPAGKEGSMAHLKTSATINAPVDRVDAVVRDPNNWAKFTTGMSMPTKISGSGGVGTQVEHRMALMWGISRPAITKVVEERHDPDGGTFWRWEMTGAVSAWWTCHHKPHDGKTQIASELNYTPPCGALGRLCDRLFIARGQMRGMHKTVENVKRLAEAS
jgi:ligand-binding SRPBCC domain-containing protein